MNEEQINDWLESNVKPSSNHYSVKRSILKAYQEAAGVKNRESNKHFTELLDAFVAPTKESTLVYDQDGNKTVRKGLYRVEFKESPSSDFGYSFEQRAPKAPGRKQGKSSIWIKGYIYNVHFRQNGSIQLGLVDEDGVAQGQVYVYTREDRLSIKNRGAQVLGAYCEARIVKNVSGATHTNYVKVHDFDATDEMALRIHNYYKEAYDWLPEEQAERTRMNQAVLDDGYVDTEIEALEHDSGLPSISAHMEDYDGKVEEPVNNEEVLNDYLQDYVQESTDKYTSIHNLYINFLYRNRLTNLSEEGFTKAIKERYEVTKLTQYFSKKLGIVSIEGHRPNKETQLIPVEYKATFGGFRSDYATKVTIPTGFIYSVEYNKDEDCMHVSLMTLSGGLIKDVALDYPHLTKTVLEGWYGSYASVVGSRLRHHHEVSEQYASVSGLIHDFAEKYDFNESRMNDAELINNMKEALKRVA